MSESDRPRFSRVLLKISGEAFAGGSNSVDVNTTHAMAAQIADVSRDGVSVAIVVGGGTPFLPPVTEDVRLELVETRTFGSRVVYERYGRARDESD